MLCKYCNIEREHSSAKDTTYLHNHIKRCLRRFGVDVSQQLIDATIAKLDGSTVLRNFVFMTKRVKSWLQ